MQRGEEEEERKVGRVSPFREKGCCLPAHSGVMGLDGLLHILKGRRQVHLDANILHH